MVLLWVGFNLSLMTIWGRPLRAPSGGLLLIGVPLLQVPAAWLSHRVAFGDGEDVT